MGVIGVNITKIEVERKPAPSSSVKINNNIGVSEINTKDFSFGMTKQQGLTFHFNFKCDYQPDFGRILLEGHVVYLDEEQKLKSLLSIWKKKKTVAGDVMESVLNAAYTKCNIAALKLSQEVNLPNPILLPKVKRVKKGVKKK